MSAGEITALLVVATLGHAMAAVWYVAYKNEWKLCEKKIYAIKISDKQMRRELLNSIHTPIHAIILAAFLAAGSFQTEVGRAF